MSTIDAVLLDDDLLVQQAWAYRAQSGSKKLLLFSTVEQFSEILPDLAKSTTIFIDSSLGKGVKGEDFAKQLYEMGFRELYLSTGYAASQFPPMPWIKGVIGKEPPDWFFAD